MKIHSLPLLILAIGAVGNSSELLTDRTTSEIQNSAMAIDFETFQQDPVNVSLSEQTAQAVAQSGVKWARVFANWNKIELSSGVYSYEGVDPLVNRLQSHGFKIFMVLNGGTSVGGNPLYAGGDSPTGGNGAQDPWLNFVQETVTHFRDGISHWEIWNEPNLDWKPVPNADDYADLAYATAVKIRSVQPSAKCILGGTSMVDMKFFETVLPLVGPQIDAVGIHPYRQYPEQSQDAFLALYPGVKPNAAFVDVGANSYGAEISAIKTLLTGFGLSRLEIWSTEAGYPSSTESFGTFPGSSLRQAKSLSRYFLLNLSLGVERSSWFRALDHNYFANLYTASGQPWVEDYTDPSFLNQGKFATFSPFTLAPTTSLSIPATSFTSSQSMIVGGNSISPSAPDNFAEYQITVPTPADYAVWFHLQGPDPAAYGVLIGAVNGNSTLQVGAQTFSYSAFNGLSAILQGQSDFSQKYYCPLIYAGAQEQYSPVVFSLSGTTTLRIQLIQGSVDEIRLVRLGEVTPKKSFTALKSLTSLFDDRVGLSDSLHPVFTNRDLSAMEWQNFQQVTFLAQGSVPLIAYWIGTEPVDVFSDREVDVSLPFDLPDPVLVDPLEGTFISISRSPSGTFSLPTRDYPLILTGRSGLGTTSSSLLPREEVFNFPNPVRGNSTVIRFYLTQSAATQIRIFNRNHDEVLNVGVSGVGGKNTYEWTIGDIANGVYFCQIKAGSEKVTFKILLLR